MKPYIIKRHQKNIFILYFFSFISIINVLLLIVVPFERVTIIAICSVIFFAICIHLWDEYIKFKREGIDYDALVISENGVEFGDENEVTNIAWEDISEIFIQRKGYSRNIWADLVFCLRDGEKCIFSLEDYMPGVNIFRIRKALRYFSNRKDIITQSCNLWLL